MKAGAARKLVRIVIFWAAFCFAVLILDMVVRGPFWAMQFSWPQATIALGLAFLTELILLPRLQNTGVPK